MRIICQRIYLFNESDTSGACAVYVVRLIFHRYMTLLALFQQNCQIVTYRSTHRPTKKHANVNNYTLEESAI